MNPLNRYGISLPRHSTTILLAVISVVLSLLVLNRWMVTDAGLFSYRRVWQLFVSYSDFGFMRRALVGSLFSWSGLNRLFDNPYIFAHFIHGIAIVLLASLVSLHILKHEDNMSTALKAIVFLSPAFIIQLGYNTGTLDIYVLLAATVTILFVRNLYLFSLLLTIGILIHELYLFTVPAQLLAFYWKTHGWNDMDKRKLITTFRLPVLCLAIALMLVFFFGRLDMPPGEFEAIMEWIKPSSTYRFSDKVSLGHYELTTGISRNLFLGYRTRPLHLYLYLTLPLFYMTAVVVVLAKNGGTTQSRIFSIAAVLFPLLISVIAVDMSRWVGMSANMSILLLLLIATDRRVRISRLDCLVILPFTLLAPLGTMLHKPFPIHQLIIERLVM